MKVLMFSTDGSICYRGTPARSRMQEYAALFDELCIFVLARLNNKMQQDTNDKKNLAIQSFGGSLKIVSFARALFCAARIIRTAPKEWVVSTQEEFTGIIGWFLKIRYGVRWQAQIHTDLFSPFYKKIFWKNRIRVWMARQTFPRASAIRVVSERIKKSLEMRGVTAPIIVLPIYTDLDFFREVSSRREKEYLTIATVSRPTREKNTNLARSAVQELKKTYLKTEHIILGSGSDAAGVRIILERSDCFLLTSWYEGYGLAVVEAMAAGRCVIMSDVGIAGELVKHGENGLIFQPGNKDELMGLLQRVAGDFELRKKLGEAAKRSVAHLPSKSEYLKAFRASFDVCKN